MLGDLIYEGKGKIISRRILETNIDGTPRIEISMTATGEMKKDGIGFKDMWTYWNEKETKGRGRGVLNIKDENGNEETAFIEGHGIGNQKSQGVIHYAGANFYTTQSNGKLAFLNNTIAVFEAEMDDFDNQNIKVWEWK